MWMQTKRVHSSDDDDDDESSSSIPNDSNNNDNMSRVNRKKQKRRAVKKAKENERGKEEMETKMSPEELARKQKIEEEKAQALEWLKGMSIEDIVRKDLFEKETADRYKKEFKEKKPFPLVQIHDFMDNTFLEQVLEEVKEEEFYLKSNDLYTFLQSNDLKKCEKPLISKVREVIYSQKFRDVLGEITGIKLSPLSETVAMSSSIYQKTNKLLCHDDELDKRRIAYILYMVPEDWNKEDGGLLDLFECNEQNQPMSISDSIVPKWNTLLFFEVSPRSFHQVSEVLSDKTRVTIGGWLHGESIIRPPVTPLPEINVQPLTTSSSVDEWINREYRKKNQMKKILNQFLEESTMELQDFLRHDKYEAVLKALEEEKEIEREGPYNKKNYEKVVAKNGILKQLSDFFISKEFGQFVQDMTGLKILKGHTETRKFSPGSYTLLHDDDPEIKQVGLDLNLSLMSPYKKWSTDMGGLIHYVDEGQEEPLISIPPFPNTLTVIYRAEPGTMRFVQCKLCVCVSLSLLCLSFFFSSLFLLLSLFLLILSLSLVSLSFFFLSFLVPLSFISQFLLSLPLLSLSFLCISFCFLSLSFPLLYLSLSSLFVFSSCLSFV